MSQDFQPAPGLHSPHLQTLWGPLLRPAVAVERRAEKLLLADGDHLWLFHAGPAPERDRPRVLILHGLAGCEDSHYARGLQARLAETGIPSTLACARGAGGRPNDRARTWHAGETDDPARVLAHLRAQTPGAPLLAVGYSLGGSQLLNLLADPEAPELDGAVAVSVPLRLDRCAERMDRGFSRVYRNHLIRQLVAGLETKKEYLRERFPEQAARLEALGELGVIRSFRDFDNRVIAPLHGFRDADDYYERCSTAGKFPRIEVSTLVIHSLDDPFMVPEVVPSVEQAGAAVRLEVFRRGGHVGFVSGRALRPSYWLEERIPAFIRAHSNPG